MKESFTAKFIEEAALRRNNMIKEARKQYSADLVVANRDFVKIIRPLIDDGMPVVVVAELAGVNRQRIHQLLRLHPKETL
jgi:hypothetical protein